MKTTLILSLLLASSSAMASIDREQPKFIPELIVYGTDLHTNIEEQRKELRESLHISHEEMLETIRKNIKIDKSNFTLPEFNKGS